VPSQTKETGGNHSGKVFRMKTDQGDPSKEDEREEKVSGYLESLGVRLRVIGVRNGRRIGRGSAQKNP